MWVKQFLKRRFLFMICIWNLLLSRKWKRRNPLRQDDKITMKVRYSHRSPASSASPPDRTSLFPAWRSGPTALSPCPSACRCSGCQWREAWSWYSARSSSPPLVAPLSCSFLFVLRTCSSARIPLVLLQELIIQSTPNNL